LDDLQENLADVEYNFSQKFETDTGLDEKAQLLLKKKQLLKARLRHQEAQSDIFQL